MPKPAEQVKTKDRLIEYLILNPEATARRMAADLGIDKTSINSVLYANDKTFVSMGDKPPLWSVRSAVEVDHFKQLKNPAPTLPGFSRKSAPRKKEPPTAKRRGHELREEIQVLLNMDTSTTVEVVPDGRSIHSSSISETENPKQIVPNPRPVSEEEDNQQSTARTRQQEEFLDSQSEQKFDDAPEELFDELKYEIEHLVRNFPGIHIDELVLMLDVDRDSISSRLQGVRYLVMTDDNKSAEYTDSELRFLDDIAKAATLAFPLSTDEYDNLVRRGFVKGVTSVRIGQVFGSWRAACELAGVEAPSPLRQNYERRWSERELAEAVARYLSEPEFRGANHRYEEWRKRNLNTDEIPSSGTLKNYLGRSWPTVRNRGLLIMREQWLSIQENENNG